VSVVTNGEGLVDGGGVVSGCKFTDTRVGEVGRMLSVTDLSLVSLMKLKLSFTRLLLAVSFPVVFEVMGV